MLPGGLDGAEISRLSGESIVPLKDSERAFRFALSERHECEVVVRMRVRPGGSRAAWERSPRDEEVPEIARRFAMEAEAVPAPPCAAEELPCGWMSKWEEVQQ